MLAVLGAADYRIRFVDQKLLSVCKTMDDAIKICIQMASVKYKRATLADLLEIDKGQLSKILAGKGYNFPPRKLAMLMNVCQNYAPLQYLMKEMNFNSGALEMLKKLTA